MIIWPMKCSSGVFHHQVKNLALYCLKLNSIDQSLMTKFYATMQIYFIEPSKVQILSSVAITNEQINTYCFTIENMFCLKAS